MALFIQIKQLKCSIPALPVTSTKEGIEGAEFNFSDVLKQKVAKMVGYNYNDVHVYCVDIYIK